jgi:hypothetical protein
MRTRSAHIPGLKFLLGFEIEDERFSFAWVNSNMQISEVQPSTDGEDPAESRDTVLGSFLRDPHGRPLSAQAIQTLQKAANILGVSIDRLPWNTVFSDSSHQSSVLRNTLDHCRSEKRKQSFHSLPNSERNVNIRNNANTKIRTSVNDTFIYPDVRTSTLHAAEQLHASFGDSFLTDLTPFVESEWGHPILVATGGNDIAETASSTEFSCGDGLRLDDSEARTTADNITQEILQLGTDEPSTVPPAVCKLDSFEQHHSLWNGLGTWTGPKNISFDSDAPATGPLGLGNSIVRAPTPIEVRARFEKIALYGPCSKTWAVPPGVCYPLSVHCSPY